MEDDEKLIELKEETELKEEKELEEEKEYIPDEVKNNLTTENNTPPTKVFEKEEEKKVSVQKKSFFDIKKRNKMIKDFLFDLVYILNSLPFPLVFVEVLLRAIFDYSYEGRLVALIIFYFLSACCFILEPKEEESQQGKFTIVFGALFAFVIFCLIIGDIVCYFKESENMINMVETLIKFKIVCYFIALGYDLLTMTLGYPIDNIWLKDDNY